MHHTMTAAAPARTVTGRRPAVAVKSDVRTGHDIAYVTRGHASGCAGAMAYYYTRTGDPPGTWEGRGTAALGVSGTVQAEIAERLYQHGVGPGGERIIRHAAPKAGEDQAVAEAVAIARYREEHPFASASEINAERTRIRTVSPGISRPYYDVTSSASKSVSVLHASLRVAAGQARHAGDHVKAAALDSEAQAIEDALLDAVREGLELLEAMACYVRTGHHSASTGEWRDGNGLVATSWLHMISRDGDPQLHVHLAVLNAVQRADGADDRWRAVDGQHFYQLRYLYGVTVDRAFEQRLLGMGYAMTGRADGNGAEVGGVSQPVMDRFSSRAQAIDGRLRTWADQYTARHGTPPSRRTIYLMGQQIARDTRRPKAEARRMAGGVVTGHELTDEERLKAWEDQTTADELQVLSTVYAEAKAYAARSAARLGLAEADKARAARIALAEAQRQRSVWGISDLCLEIHRALPVGATPADITEVAMLALSSTAGAEVVQVSPAPDLMDVGTLGVRQSDGQSILRKPNTMRWAALDHLNLEETVVSQATRPIRPLVTEQQVRDELDRHHQDLDVEQHQAVITLLAADRAMALLTAPAGAGKTRTIAAAATVWRALTGGRLIGLTLSENAARVMTAEGLPDAYNIAQFLGKCPDTDKLRHPVHVGPADKLGIDEAGQVGTSDLALIQQAAGPAGILAVGDPAQLGPVEAGGWFPWFNSELGAAELHEVRRFTSPWEATASLQLRRGDTSALAAYDAHGRIRAGHREAMHDKAALAFLADFLDGKDSILLAGSNAEAADLARRVQDRLIGAGHVQHPQLELADDNRAGIGDLVRARENAKTIDAAGQPLANRDVLRIEGRTAGQVQVRRQADGGWSGPFLLPERYLADHSELAYAGNTHVAQGRTTGTAHLLVTGTLNRRSLYVGMTRGRHANTAYVATGERVPGREPELVNPEVVLAEIIGNDGTELTATEAIRQAQEWSASTGHLASIWAAAMTDTVKETIDSQLKEHLAASKYRRYLREPQRQPLQQALTERKLNGEDLTTLIEQITAADLTGARSISAVLHGRLAWTGKARSIPSTWAQRTPENAPQLAHEAAKAIDYRITALGLRCAEKPEPWLTSQLGAFPAHGSALEQQDYLHRAGSAAAYREAAHIIDPHQAVSPTPHKGDPVRERMRRDTITHLEIRDEEQLYRAMSRGDLEAKELQARRAYAAGPKDVAADLKYTAQAEADQRQAAVEAEAQGDEATAKALYSLADLLGTQKTALEADHAKHENWSAETAGRREEGGKARAELGRRGQTPEIEPSETTLEWWQRFERDCQAFEQHLINLEAQAETEGRPWPPQPTTEHRVAPEAERINEAGLYTAWSAEIRDEPSYEPEPEIEMPEATAEI
jgi:conjugative relaxase-like TrwC/TraI family protein